MKMFASVLAVVLALLAFASATSNVSAAASVASSFACISRHENSFCGTEGNMMCCPETPLPAPSAVPVPSAVPAIARRAPNWRQEDLPRICRQKCHEFTVDEDCMAPCVQGLPVKSFQDPKYPDHYPCIPRAREIDCSKRRLAHWCCKEHVYKRDATPMTGFNSRVNVPRADEMNLHFYTPRPGLHPAFNGSSSMFTGNDSVFAGFWHDLSPTKQHEIISDAGFSLDAAELAAVAAKRSERVEIQPTHDILKPVVDIFNEMARLNGDDDENGKSKRDARTAEPVVHLEEYAALPADADAWGKLRSAVCSSGAERFDDAAKASMTKLCGRV